MSFLLPCGGIMNNIDLLKTITNYKKIKNPAYPAQESLLIHLYIRVNDKIQSIIENELSEYRINTSTFMVLVSLYMSDDYCQSPSDIYKELQFSKTNITHIIDKLEKKNIKVETMWLYFLSEDLWLQKQRTTKCEMPK